MFQQSGKNWKITIDRNSISGGWGDTFWVSAAIETSDKKYSKSEGISLYRSGFEGHIAPGEGWTELTDAGSTITSLPLNAISALTNPDNKGNLFTILKGGRIVQFPAIEDNNVIGAAYDIPSASASENSDIVSLYDVASTPVEYLIYSYDTASAGYIGYIPPAFSTGNATWVNVTKGIPHIFSFGPTKNDLYFTNGQYIGAITISGALASASTNVNALNLGSGWVATSICPYGNYMAIVGYRSNIGTVTGSVYTRNESKLWLWDGYSPDPNFLYDLEDNYVSAIKNDKGILKIWTQGKNNTTKIKYFTGTRVETIFESAQIGRSPRHGSVDVFQNIPHWVGNSGQALNCLDGEAFHYRSLMSGISDVGMIKNLSGGYLYTGVYTGSVYKIYYIDTTKYYTGYLRTRLFSEIPPRSKITKFKIYFSQFGTGASVILSLFKDYNTVSVGGANDLLYRTISRTIMGDIRYYSFEKNIIDLNSFYMHITFNHAAETNTAAIIRKVEILGEATDMY